MRKMSELKKAKPFNNMIRVLVQWNVGYLNGGTLDFMFYKDGMLQSESGEWYHISDFSGWMSIKDLKNLLNLNK